MKKNIPGYVTAAVPPIDLWLSYQQKRQRIPGLAVGIVYKDKVVFQKTYGYADLEKKKEITPQTGFRIASISKMFTATAIMQLQEQGKLNLEDPVSKYLPWVSSSKDNRIKKITIYQLLTHTAGVYRDGNTSHWYDDLFPEIEELKKYVSTASVIYAAFTKFKYSNFGYAILGQAIESVSKMPYEKYIQKKIIDELKLKNTAPDYSNGLKIELANGYSRDIPGKERTVFNHPETNAYQSATGFISSLEDLCTYVSAHMSGSNKLLSDESKRNMQRIHWFRPGETDHYGVGYEVSFVNDQLIAGHGGGFQGYMTRIGFDAKEHIGVVVLTNAIDADAYSLLTNVFKTIYSVKNNWTEFNTTVKTNGNLRRYEGLFFDRFGFVATVRINNRLVAIYLDAQYPLEGYALLTQKTKNTFTISGGYEYDYVGEDITFKFDNGKLQGIYYGPNFFRIYTE